MLGISSSSALWHFLWQTLFRNALCRIVRNVSQVRLLIVQSIKFFPLFNLPGLLSFASHFVISLTAARLSATAHAELM